MSKVPLEPSGLPKAEDNNLRKATRALDDKNFPVCFRLIEQVLKTFPTNADTLGIKALAIHGLQEKIKNNVGRRGKAAKAAQDNAAAMEGCPPDVLTLDSKAECKKAIMANMKSFTAWHCMAELHKKDRTEKGDAEAMKCYRQAIKAEAAEIAAASASNQQSGPAAAMMMGARAPERRLNINLQRDSTAWATHMRDWNSLIEWRQAALNNGNGSGIRVNWIWLLAANYMAGNKELSSAIADVLVQLLDAGDNQAEKNELQLWRASVRLENRDAQGALKLLTSTGTGNTATEPVITDRGEKQKLLARAYLATGNKAKAKEALTELLRLRESEKDALYQMADADKITLDPIGRDPDGGEPREVRASPQFCAILDEMAAKFPKCDAAKRLALDYCDVSTAEGEADFMRRLRAYITRFVRDLVPSLVTVLDSLYVSPKKVSLIEKVFFEWQTKLEAGDQSDFAKTSSSAAAASSQQPKNPTLILAVYEFLSQHFRNKCDYEQAHTFIDKAIDHTPTHEILYLAKARIYNAQRDAQNAAEAADTAQRLDQQDKYLNNKSAQYWLRAGEIEKAEKMLGLFFKKGPVDDIYLQSIELQYTWYERELGAAYLAKGDFANALTALQLVETHQDHNHNEMVDFHNWTLKHQNVRQWVDVIKNEDVFFVENNHFLQSCPNIIRAYLGIFDAAKDEKYQQQQAPVEVAAPAPEAAAASSDESKPVVASPLPCSTPEERAAFDLARHAPRPELEHPEDAEQKRIDKLSEDYWRRPDVNGPLQKCLKYLNALQKSKRSAIETHVLAFEVHSRGNRLLQCVSAVAELHRLVKENRVVTAAGKVEVQRAIAELGGKLNEMMTKTAADAKVKDLANKAIAKFPK